MKKKLIKRTFIVSAIALIAIIIYFLFSNYHRMKPALPPPLHIEDTVATPLSQLNLPITLLLDTVQKKLNDALPAMLFTDTGLAKNDNDHIALYISRKGEITLQARNNLVNYQVPLHLLATAKVKRLRVTINKTVEADAVLYLTSVLSIQNNWIINSYTTLNTIRWIQPPVLQIGPVAIDLKNKVNTIVHQNQSKLTAIVDQIISQKINLKKITANLWLALQKPIRINSKHEEVWLAIRPQTWQIGAITSADRELHIETGITGYLRTVFTRDTEVEKEVLPDLTPAKNLSDSFDLYLKSQVRFDDLGDAITKGIASKKIQLPGKSITISKVEVMGSGDGIAIMLRVTGDLKGDIYMTGKLEFDSLTNTLQLTHFDYDYATEETLLKMADWVFHSDFKQTIADRLHLDLNTQISSIPSLIENALNNGNVGKTANLTFTSFAFHVKNIEITKDAILILINATGKAGITIHHM